MKKLALIDIDGVLADERHRTPFAEQKEWNRYFAPEMVIADGVWREGRALVNSLVAEGWEIAYLTGRREEIRNVTEQWLDSHQFPWGRLVMRPLPNGSGKVPLPQFKANVMKTLPPLWDEVVLYDDDPAVIALVQKELGKDKAVHCTWHVKPDFLVAKSTV